MPTIIESPATDIRSLVARRAKSQRDPTIQELRKLSLQALQYLTLRVSDVEKIAALVPSADDRKELQKKVETLEAKDNKSDADYLQLAVQERKLDDFAARNEKAKERAATSDVILAAELQEWAGHLTNLLSEANASQVYESIARVLTPFLEGQSARQFVETIPAYSSRRFYNRWTPPSTADVMREEKGLSECLGTNAAKTCISFIQDALKGDAFKQKNNL
jgi:sugar diacid utilization regulator